ncbi:GNAT family N-acetyltransferase [Clostridium sp. C8]|uniref:GNAT family N-acetyltransferase n=1 Tax=Clostridium sp. C8 TaxID=1667357 RepID=UPI001FA72FBB|nr:GNAT family N-acetyltransferase [Clostridium sp. C8]
MKEVKMIIKEYNYLPEEAGKIRSEVFVKEQRFVEEFDEIDGIAKHMIAYEREQPIATCRIYFNSKKQSFVIGRIAVVKEWRGKKIGERILNAAEDNIRRDGGKSVMLLGQVRVVGFYENQGYTKQGVAYFEEDCLHIWMKKNLEDIGK